MIFLATWCVLDVMFGNKEEEQNIPCDGWVKAKKPSI